MINNLSPSRASQFKTCPKQFEYANVLKIKEPTNAVQAKGTTIHTALEKIYDKDPHERTLENLQNIFRAEWNKVRDDDEHLNLFKNREEERAWGLDALQLLSNYFKLENPTVIRPFERERWVRGEIEDLNLRGILDRMDQDDDGNLVILDYKSGKAPAIKYKEPRFFALKLYALLIQKELGKMPTELKLIYLKNSTIHTLEVTEEILIEARRELLSIWEKIKTSFKDDEFPATKNTLCDWCYYKPICPVYNNDPPDTEVLKRLSIEIRDLEELIMALSMFDDANELPISSDLHGVEMDNVKSKKETLEKKREPILAEIVSLLGE